MNALVIDASIAVKWVVEEEGTPAALALRGRQLTAPDLILVECANLFWKKVRRGEFTKDEAGMAARLLANADMELCPTRPMLDAAMEIALLLDHPAYDCLYLALAELRGLTFVTADLRLFNKVAGVSRFKQRVLAL